MKSKSIKITVWGLKEIGANASTVGLSGSSTQVIKIFFPRRVSKAEVLTGDTAQKVDKLLEKLREVKVL